MTDLNPKMRREAVAAAVFNLVDAAARTVLEIKTSSRRLRSPDSVANSQCPALFMVQIVDEESRSVIGLPASRSLKYEFWIYTVDPQVDSAIPAQQLNNVVDAVEAAMAPSPLTGQLTLGGLVLSCRIDGTIEFYENATQDGKSIVAIPVTVLIP